MSIKAMIERCVERFRRGDCATCDNRERCAAARWQQAFAIAGRAPDAAAPPPRQQLPWNALRALAADVAGAVQRHFPAHPAHPAHPAPAARPSSLRRRVEAQLEPRLAGGDLGIEGVAAALGLSRQTLYRRLKDEGVTFEQVLDELRHRLALRYLREGMGVKQAAYRLGFSEPAAFSRAFKRWTGHPPSEHRGA